MIKLVTFQLDNTAKERFLVEGLEAHMGDVLRGMANSVRNEIMRLASTELKLSRAEYKRALGMPKVNVRQGRAVIELNGTLANWVEDGIDPFDMHETILSGPGVDKNAEGDAYARVPFRHMGPSAKGATPMGMQYRNTGGIDVVSLGKKVYSYAKDVGSKPGQAKEMPGGLFPKIQPNSRQVGPYKADAHTHDPFKGMRREQASTGSQLKTYRTISDAVPNKWYHPGIEAHNFFDRASEKAEEAFNVGLRTTLDAIIKAGS